MEQSSILARPEFSRCGGQGLTVPLRAMESSLPGAVEGERGCFWMWPQT